MTSSSLLRRAPRRLVHRALRIGLLGAAAGGLSLAVAAPGDAAGPAAGASPSGVHAVSEAAPTGDLPGWKQIYVDNFSTNVALGSFPAAVSGKWGAYPYPWKDTTGYGTYDPGKVVSISNGVLNNYIHTEGGVPRIAALTPKVPGTSKYGQLYGRYAVRWRSDKLPSYKVAWMLWPDSNNQQADGEIDFPEMNLDSPYLYGFMHHTNSSGGGDQDYAKVAYDATAWHTTVIEWSPNLVRFILDGKEIMRTTTRVPKTAMHWVLQTETAINTGHAPSSTTKGNVQIDWVAAWAYSPTTTTATATADTTAPTVSVTGLTAGATIGSTVTFAANASDPSGVTQVKWYVDGNEIGYDTASPWTDTWDTRTVGNGAHTVFAKARDAAGNWGTSASLSFSVKN